MGNQSSTTKVAAFLSNLPLEVIGHICMFLPVEDVAHLFQTCSTLSKLSNDSYFWKNLYLRDFSHADISNSLEPQDITVDEPDINNDNAVQEVTYSSEELKDRCILVAENVTGISWATLTPEQKPPLLEKKDQVINEIEYKLLELQYLFGDKNQPWNPIAGVVILSPLDVVLIEFQTTWEALFAVSHWDRLAAVYPEAAEFITIHHTLHSHAKKAQIKQFLEQFMSANEENSNFLISWKNNYKRQLSNQRIMKQQQAPPKSLMQKFLSKLSGTEEAMDFPVSSKLKKPVKPEIKKQSWLETRRFFKGPLVTSVLAFGMRGAGTRSIINWMTQQNPYSTELRNDNGWKVTFPQRSCYFKNTALTFFICNDEFMHREVQREFKCFESGVKFDAILIVVDSQHDKQEELEELSILFNKFLEHAKAHKPDFNPCILCLAHKQDHTECLSPEKIAQILKLESLDCNWAVMPSSLAIHGSIEACFTWLLKWAKKNDSSYFKRTGCTII